MSLADLLNQATPGPWGAAYWPTPEPTHWVGQHDPDIFSSRMLGAVTGPLSSEADAHLIALAPDMARLLIDMADAANKVTEHHHDTCNLELGLSPAYPCSCGVDALRLALLQFAALDAKAGETT